MWLLMLGEFPNLDIENACLALLYLAERCVCCFQGAASPIFFFATDSLSTSNRGLKCKCWASVCSKGIDVQAVPFL